MAESSIIRGTTPTIKFTFSTIDSSDITDAFLTINQNDTKVIEKDIDTASIDTGEISWQLTQEECLSLELGNATFMLNWLLADGTRGASIKGAAKIIPNYKNEVIGE